MSEQTTTQRNGKIEFLRFIFAMYILFFHIGKRFFGTPASDDPTGFYFFLQGCFGVEFFFLVSGYLLASKIYKMRNVPRERLGSETAHLIWKKFFHVFPYHAYAMIIMICVNVLFLYHNAADRISYALNSWSSLFLLEVFGFESTWANKLSWYIAVWLMVTAILYPIGRRHYDFFMNAFCPMAALFLLGYMDYTTGSIGGIDEIDGIFYKCFLRGISEMSLGCCAFSIVRALNRIHWSKNGKRFFGIFEIAGYLFMLLYVNTKYYGPYQFPMFFFLWMLVVLSFSNINPCASVFNHPFFYYLGRVSLLIYLNQFYCIRIVQNLLPHCSFLTKLLAIIILVFSCSLICDKLISLLMKKRPVKNWLIIPDKKP